MLTVLPLFFAQTEPIDVRSIANPFDYGLAIGTITVLFAILFYLGREVVSRFDKISSENREQVQAILAAHKSERNEWKEDSQARAAKIDQLCDRMIHALAKHEER